MSKYDLEELTRLWQLQRLSVEQAVGQLTLHAQDVVQQMPEQAEATERLKGRLYRAMYDVARLKREEGDHIV